MAALRSYPIFAVLVLTSCGPTLTEEIGGGGGGGGDGVETCGNGLDDDRDGQPDDGCGCARGETQACWPGEPTQRNEGACRDGVQTCEGDAEFAQWGPCEGANMPQNDLPADGVDMDCGGSDGPDTEAGCVPNEYGEGCFNGRDEDCDGLIDCADPDCAAKCGDRCVEGSSVCSDGVDSNCDEVIDCETVDCADECGGGDGGGGGPTCTTEVCNDGIDNDCDALTDCMDTNCGTSPDCGYGVCTMPTAEDCTGGYDEDCDMAVDCDDPDCASAWDCICNERCVPGTERYCDTVAECDWGIQRCNPDGSWGACLETSDRPPGCEASGPNYDRACCFAAPGTCCQDYPNNSSIGECSGVAYCTY